METIIKPGTLLKINCENWAVWKFQVSVYFEGQGAVWYLTGLKTELEATEARAVWIKDYAKTENYGNEDRREDFTHLLSCESISQLYLVKAKNCVW